MTIYNISENVAYCEAKGLSLIFAAYAEEAAGQEISEIGFNPKSGYTYIALENGVQICSMLGGSVEYITTDEWGNETFLETYEEALEILNQ